MKLYERFIKLLIYCVLIILFVSNIKIIFRQRLRNLLYMHREKYKYILLWTSNTHGPLKSLSEGTRVFESNKCPITNCYVTTNRTLLKDITMFDALLFHGPNMLDSTFKLPPSRSPHQKYVFVSQESAFDYPICGYNIDSVFNWTWTYKLDSDIRCGYIAIKELVNETVIGPNKEIHWLALKDMTPIDEETKYFLTSKKKAVAWYANNCVSRSGRELYVEDLVRVLKTYGHEVDVFGKCGNISCVNRGCDLKIKKYYFYLAFEQAMSEDYVTANLMIAIKNNVVPIVFGGANYTRFMPDGMYLNAVKMGVVYLAYRINELIEDPEQYAEYFKWKNHYSYHESLLIPETNEYCQICNLLHNEDKVKERKVYRNFKKWWNDEGFCDGTWGPN